MASLGDLPTELIDQILFLVAEEDPPSKRFLHEEPSVSLLSSDDRPLKNLALMSRSLCQVARHHLFTSLKADLDDIPSLLLFVEEPGLQGRVQSLVLYSTSTHEDRETSTSLFPRIAHPSESGEQEIQSVTWLRIKAIIDAVDPVSVAFLLPPRMFECILPYELCLEDEWAFNISLQILRLEQCPEENIEHPERTTLLGHNIFDLRQWRHMIFNEGSSVQVYSTYEYFFKRMPSLLNPASIEASHYIGSNIFSLDYVGVFPIHGSNFLPDHLGRFDGMRSLRIRFAPSASNDILDNPTRLGRCQRSDLWSELRGSYKTFAEYIRYGLGTSSRLRHFTVLDQFPGSTEMIKEEFRGLEAVGWYLASGGHSLEYLP